MIDRSDILSSAHLLLGPAEAALRARLAATPDAVALRWRLAEVLRQRGDLAGAADACRRVLDAEPDHDQAAAVLAALDGRPVPEGEGLRPAPFALVEGLLSDAEQGDLWGEVEDHADQFTPSMVGTGHRDARLNPDQRVSEVMLQAGFPTAAARFRERVPALVRHAWDARGLEPFEPTRVEFVLSVHTHGHFFKVHQDYAREGILSTRAVTFVYYFHRRPRRFSGGDLLLLDTNLATDRYGAAYTRVAPAHGRMVVFPSPYFHQVTPIVSGTDDRLDGRFAVTGWLHTDRPA